MKSFKLFVVVLLVLLTTGCIKLDMDLEVNSDSTISGSMIFAVSDALNELAEGESTGTNSDELFDTKAEGVTSEPYDQGGFVGEKFIFDRVPASAFKGKDGDASSLSIAREGDLVTLSGNLDLRTETGDTDQSAEGDLFGDAFSSALAKSIFSSAELRIRVKFPADVVSTTGTLSADKRTVTWEPKIGDNVNLNTVVRIPSAPIGLIGAIAAIFLVAISGLIWFFRKKRSEFPLTSPEL